MSEDSTKVSQEVLRAMRAERLSGTEVLVMLALMHHGIDEDNEVGVASGDYAMSAADVAEYVGDMSEGHVRRVISSLTGKGVLVRSRRKHVGYGMYVSVHALSERFANRAGVGGRWLDGE